jgi:hypothetical protein
MAMTAVNSTLVSPWTASGRLYAGPHQLPDPYGFGLQVLGDIAGVVRLGQEQHYELLTSCATSVTTGFDLGCCSPRPCLRRDRAEM